MATTRRAATKKTASKADTLDARALKRLARTHATTPERLLAQIDQFASMGPWTRLPVVNVPKAWSPPARMTVIDGGAAVGAKLDIRDGTHDFGVVIVLGDITCGSLQVASGWTLLCTGAMTAKGTIVATAGDSATYVGGTVTAKRVKSGDGAWLTLFGGAGTLKAPVSRYVMVDGVGPFPRK